MDILTLFIIFASGLFAGVVNTLAGGGSLLTLPILMLAGLPAPVANGTNRIAIWFQCVTAVVGFTRKGVEGTRFSLSISLPTIIGAIIGAQLAVEISEYAFRVVLALVMLIVVGLVIWNPKPKSHPGDLSGKKKIIAHIVFFFIGIYGGFIQAGVGFLLTAALALLCGFDLVVTAGVKVLVVAIYTFFAILVFIINGQVDWWVALVLSLGNALGGWIGCHIAITKGEAWLKGALAVTVVALALKLLGFFPFLG